MSFLAVGAVSAGLGAASSIYGAVKGIGQQKEANKINPTFQNYSANPYAQEQLGAAQQLFNGRMAGAADESRNIAASQSNFANSAARNATNGSQALSLAAAGQGQADASYNRLGVQEAQNKQNMLQNLNQAYAANINEGDKEYKSQMDKYQLDLNRQSQLAGAGATNVANGISGVGSSVLGFGNLLGSII